MTYHKLFLAIAVLAFTVMACSFTVNLPFTNLKTSPTKTDSIDIPLPTEAGTVTDIELAFGAGKLDVNPGAQEALVSGSAIYNVEEFKPRINQEQGKVRISQGDVDIKGIPSIGGDVKNEWDFKLGVTPINLTIAAGAYQGRFELGGLDIRSLHITDGAAEAEVSFSQANLGEMTTLRYETGASKVSLTGLGNANFEELIFKSGAGDYTLDFSGKLLRDASVKVQAGLSSLTISIPPGTAARLTVTGGLSHVEYTGVWETSGNAYIIPGEGPTLTLEVEMGAGNLSLRNP